MLTVQPLSALPATLRCATKAGLVVNVLLSLFLCHQHCIPPPLFTNTLNLNGKGVATMTEGDPMQPMIAVLRRCCLRRTSR